MLLHSRTDAEAGLGKVPQKPPQRAAGRRNRFVMECHKHRLVRMKSGSWRCKGQITGQHRLAAQQGPHARVDLAGTLAPCSGRCVPEPDTIAACVTCGAVCARQAPQTRCHGWYDRCEGPSPSCGRESGLRLSGASHPSSCEPLSFCKAQQTHMLVISPARSSLPVKQEHRGSRSSASPHRHQGCSHRLPPEGEGAVFCRWMQRQAGWHHVL